MRWLKLTLLSWLLIWALSAAWAEDRDFAQEDRERPVRIEATLQVFTRQVDKRLQELDKRMGQLRGGDEQLL